MFASESLRFLIQGYPSSIAFEQVVGLQNSLGSKDRDEQRVWCGQIGVQDEIQDILNLFKDCCHRAHHDTSV
jgi:hypothetical protein